MLRIQKSPKLISSNNDHAITALAAFCRLDLYAQIRQAADCTFQYALDAFDDLFSIGIMLMRMCYCCTLRLVFWVVRRGWRKLDVDGTNDGAGVLRPESGCSIRGQAFDAAQLYVREGVSNGNEHNAVDSPLREHFERHARSLPPSPDRAAWPRPSRAVPRLRRSERR